MSEVPNTSSTPSQESTVTTHSRFLAAWWGAFIGDALSMPAHWYYNRELLERDYGTIRNYQAPKNPHPDSILWRCRYEPTGKEDDILHNQAQYWGKPGIHYHQFLAPGENTLNLKISLLLAQSLIERGRYDSEDFARRYIDFMLDAASHQDTYVEEYHREFFANYARGKPLDKCGIEDIHIGGLATLTPLILFYHKDRPALLRAVREHLRLTHKGETAARAGELFAETLYHTLKGESLEHALFESIGRSNYQLLAPPYRRWIENHPDEEVVGKLVSSGCYLEDALPATYFLALKYANDFEHGLIQNTNLGGENCYRGVVLGAILGSINGCENIPAEWVTELREVARYDALGDELWDASAGVTVG